MNGIGIIYHVKLRNEVCDIQNNNTIDSQATHEASVSMCTCVSVYMCAYAGANVLLCWLLNQVVRLFVAVHIIGSYILLNTISARLDHHPVAKVIVDIPLWFGQQSQKC